MVNFVVMDGFRFPNACHPIIPNMSVPDDTLKLADGEVKLFVGAGRITDQNAAIVCDRMVIQEFTGNKDDAVIFSRDGKRRVGRLKLLMGLGAGSPAVPVTTDFNEVVEEIGPDEEKRLLAIYDKFRKRTWAHRGWQPALGRKSE